MSMTKSRRAVYGHNWYRIESKIVKRFRRKEINRKIRHTKDPLDAKYDFYWDTMS